MSYSFSSWLFSQVYLWSSSAEDLNWILIQTGDRARLNEKPIFYTVHFLLFGVVQGVLHIFRDDDRLLLGSVKLDGDDVAAKENQPNWQTRLTNEVPALASLAAMQSAIALLVNVILYHAALRGLAWRTALFFFRPFYTLPKTNMVPATLAGINGWMWLRCFLTGFMLLFMWLAGNKMFSVLLVRPPLKVGNPLTSESKDPNGSLLNGLKSKKLPIKVCLPTFTAHQHYTNCRSVSPCGSWLSSPGISNHDERPSIKISTGKMGQCGRKSTLCVLIP